ncbi:isopentenyl-diphosphate delta-isomerase idi1 [Savitreella phatthalungensis]
MTTAQTQTQTQAQGQSVTNSSTSAGGLSLDTTDLTSATYDAEQIRLMEEVCIVLDRDDGVTGTASKKDCHLMSNIEKGLLHRAFSLFLFDGAGNLLLQQRASEKITFPDMWTNTCCSHPLACPEEQGVSGDLASSVLGVKRAAQRKVAHELGIAASDAPVAGMTYLTRIHYVAPSDGVWGEHEIDYILFLQHPHGRPNTDINPNEVRDTRWVSQAELRDMFAHNPDNLTYTPWFKLICETFLFTWWDKLSSPAGLDACKDETTIHRLGFD